MFVSLKKKKNQNSNPSKNNNNNKKHPSTRLSLSSRNTMNHMGRSIFSTSYIKKSKINEMAITYFIYYTCI